MEDRNTRLAWTTGNQLNVSRFEIERSAYGSTAFSMVGTVAVNNGTSGTYTYVDVNARNYLEKGYYRLKIIDNNGRFTYSRIAFVNFGSMPAVSLSPALVKAGEPVTIYTGSATGQRAYTGTLYNQAGQILEKWTGPASGYKQIETGRLPKGVYIVRVIQDTFTTTERFVVQ